MTEEERLELERLRLGGSRNLSEALDVPMPVTNVGLMGEPLREQPSINQIRFDSRPDRLASKDLATRDRGFFEGLKGIFTDPFGLELNEAERYAPRNQPLDIVPGGNTMRPETPMLDSVLNSGIGPFQPGAVDFSRAATTAPTTNVPSGADQPSGITMGADGVINLPALTRNDPLGSVAPEATFLRADGSIGEIFPGQRIGDAFPGNPDTPSLGGQIQGVDLPGGTGFVRAPEGMVKSIGPDGKMIFTTPEQANIIADSRLGPRPSSTGATGATGAVTVDQVNGLTEPTRTGSRAGRFFDDVKGFFREGISGGGGLVEYFTDPNSSTLESIFERRKEFLDAASEADDRARMGILQQGQPGSIQDNFVNRMATGQPLTQAETASAMQFARSKGLNFDPRTGFSQAPETVNQPTIQSVNAMAGTAPMVTAPMVTAPQGRPALSAYEQASMDREARIAARDRLPGETQTERDTRIAQSRTQGANRGGQLSQSDLRDIAQGSARGATEGERMRALQIQQRAGMGAFKPGTPRVDKLSQATSTVDRMIQNGQLSPDKRNAAIQRIMGLGDVGGAAGTSADAGVIGSAEFDRISTQLQPGGSLYEMGIRVDPSETDPYKMVYKEKPGILEGMKPGPRGREMVSPELVQQLLPYLRSVRQPNEGDFAGVGMVVNQFAGSR